MSCRSGSSSGTLAPRVVLGLEQLRPLMYPQEKKMDVESTVDGGQRASARLPRVSARGLRQVVIIAAALGLVMAGLAASVAFGAVSLSPGEIRSGLFDDSDRGGSPESLEPQSPAGYGGGSCGDEPCGVRGTAPGHYAQPPGGPVYSRSHRRGGPGSHSRPGTVLRAAHIPALGGLWWSNGFVRSRIHPLMAARPGHVPCADGTGGGGHHLHAWSFHHLPAGDFQRQGAAGRPLAGWEPGCAKLEPPGAHTALQYCGPACSLSAGGGS